MHPNPLFPDFLKHFNSDFYVIITKKHDHLKSHAAKQIFIFNESFLTLMHKAGFKNDKRYLFIYLFHTRPRKVLQNICQLLQLTVLKQHKSCKGTLLGPLVFGWSHLNASFQVCQVHDHTGDMINLWKAHTRDQMCASSISLTLFYHLSKRFQQILNNCHHNTESQLVM